MIDGKKVPVLLYVPNIIGRNRSPINQQQKIEHL